MRSLEFSRSSVRDLEAISKESEDSWGEAQRNRYMGELAKRMERLRSRPELGPTFGPLRPGLRRLIVGQHLVFYRITDDTIRIVRILHQRMDLDRHLGPV